MQRIKHLYFLRQLFAQTSFNIYYWIVKVVQFLNKVSDLRSSVMQILIEQSHQLKIQFQLSHSINTFQEFKENNNKVLFKF